MLNLNEHTGLQLRHFCTSIEEALRPLLQTKNFNEVDPEYWINSLNRFKSVLNNILGANSDEYKQLYLKHFQILLGTGIKNVDDLFKTSQVITDEVFKKLNEVY